MIDAYLQSPFLIYSCPKRKYLHIYISLFGSLHAKTSSFFKLQLLPCITGLLLSYSFLFFCNLMIYLYAIPLTRLPNLPNQIHWKPFQITSKSAALQLYASEILIEKFNFCSLKDFHVFNLFNPFVADCSSMPACCLVKANTLQLQHHPLWRHNPSP